MWEEQREGPRSKDQQPKTKKGICTFFSCFYEVGNNVLIECSKGEVPKAFWVFYVAFTWSLTFMWPSSFPLSFIPAQTLVHCGKGEWVELMQDWQKL